MKTWSAFALGLLVSLGTEKTVSGAGGFLPSNPPALVPLTNPHSPAHLASERFRRGVNLGDYLEAPAGWGVTVAAGEFAQMRAEGFDHVRVPVAWHRHTGPGPDFIISSDFFGRVDFVVTNALASGLAVLINLHHFGEFDTNPVESTGKLLALWRQIATHYAPFPPTLALELLNEPHDRATTAVVNPIYPRVIAEIRPTNPHRTIFVEPGNWGNIDELKHLVLPPQDDNLIVSVHCYEPFRFTHQGASWAGPDVKVRGIQFPGPPAEPLVPDSALKLNPWVSQWIKDYNTLPAEKNPSSPAAFTSRLAFARAWSDHYGRPVHVGEFGCYTRADPESRARYYAAVRRALDEQKLGWAIWDWNANFRYWDKKHQQPMPGMRAALFGK